MKKKIADKWVKALRSGKYKQAQNAMCVRSKGEYSFCCLGVLQDLMFQDKHKNTTTGKYKYGWDEENPNCKYSYEELKFEGDETNPRQVTLNWSGLKTLDGEFSLERLSEEETEEMNLSTYDKDKGKFNLMGLNDDSNWDFDEIADFIEKHYRKI